MLSALGHVLRAARTTRALAAAGAALCMPPHGAGGMPHCMLSSDEEDMRRLVVAAGGTDGQYTELAAIGLSTPLRALAYNAGTFKKDPVDAAELTALQLALAATTSLPEGERWASPTSHAAADVHTSLAQSQLLTQVFMGARASETKYVAELCRRAGIDVGLKGEEDKASALSSPSPNPLVGVLFTPTSMAPTRSCGASTGACGM